MRITSLDGLRGICLISMAIAHFRSPIGSYWLGAFTHHQIGYVDGALGFVFLSGFIIGIVYFKRYNQSPPKARNQLWHRAAQLYLYHLGILAFAAACVIIPFGDAPPWDARWGNSPASYAILTALTLGGPLYLDILSLYITFLIITPAALWALAHGKTLELLAVSICVWLAAQTQFPTAVMLRISEETGLLDQGIRLGIYFNRLAWQLLFFGGLTFGYHLANGRLKPSFFSSPTGRFFMKASVATFVAFAAFRMATLAEIFSQTAGDSLNKPNLSILMLANFAADAYIITWLLCAGRHEEAGLAKWLGQGLFRLTNSNILVRLGQHSLQVYAFHVIVAYLLFLASRPYITSFPDFAKELVMIASLASLWVAAWAHRLWKRRTGPAPA